jgi:hypothetical protein
MTILVKISNIKTKINRGGYDSAHSLRSLLRHPWSRRGRRGTILGKDRLTPGWREFVTNIFYPIVKNEFKNDCFEALNITNNPKRELLFNASWKLAHGPASYPSYWETWQNMQKLVEFFQ